MLIAGKIVQIIPFLFLISHTFLSKISSQIFEMTLYTEYCTIGRQLFWPTVLLEHLVRKIVIVLNKNLKNNKKKQIICTQLITIIYFAKLLK